MTEEIMDAETNEIVKYERVPDNGIVLSTAQVRERTNEIQRLYEDVLQEGTHYGKIKGCGDKPVLLQPGADKLSSMFGFIQQLDVVQTDLGNGHREYTVFTTLLSQNGQPLVERFPGVCSTTESKYKFRKQGGAGAGITPTSTPLPKRYWDEWNKAKDLEGAAKEAQVKNARAIIGGPGFTNTKNDSGKWVVGRMEKAKTGNAAKAEHDNPSDYWNTVAKIATKRSRVGAVLAATGAADIFTQDIEESPELFGGSQAKNDKIIHDAKQERNAQQEQEQRHQSQTGMAAAAERESSRPDDNHPDHPGEGDDLPEAGNEGRAKVEQLSGGAYVATLTPISIDEIKRSGSVGGAGKWWVLNKLNVAEVDKNGGAIEFNYFDSNRGNKSDLINEAIMNGNEVEITWHIDERYGSNQLDEVELVGSDADPVDEDDVPW